MGGYDGKNALSLAFFFALFGCGSSLGVPFTENFWLISVLTWILLFFGGALVPPLTGNKWFSYVYIIGIMLSSVQPALRSFANSNTTTFINLFGYLPAPTVFGLL